MKPIVVKDQARLGPGRCLALTLSGMYYRLSRSAITVLILSLAVAFLSYVLYYGILSHDVEYSAHQELRSNRLLGQWISRLSAPDQQSVILEYFLSSENDRIQEYRLWGNLSDADIDFMRTTAQQFDEFRHFFSSIPQAARAQLAADVDPAAMALELSDSVRFEKFSSQRAALGLAAPLKDQELFRTFVSANLPRFASMVRVIQSGQLRAIAAVQQHLDTLTVRDMFISPSNQFRETLARSGFRLSAAQYNELAKLALFDRDAQILKVFSEIPDAKGLLARKIGVGNISLLSTDTVVSWATSSKSAEWLEQNLKARISSSDITAERIQALALFAERNARLKKIDRATVSPQPRTTVFHLPEQTRWLVIVSFLVCMVGISNTMLMSVTDRFSEIATMKCIGAMDGFIMTLFVFEGFFQAVAGSLVGIILGVLLAILRSGVTYGMLSFESFPFGDMLIVSAVSFLAGILIAALASIAPSWAASRLAPMEAMRVE